MKKLHLAHWFFIWLLGMFILVVLTQPDERPDKLEAMSFNTTRSSMLYFNNIRSFYYNKTEEGKGVLIGYRLKSQYESTGGLPFAIYMVNGASDAYIRLDTASIVGGLNGVVFIDSLPSGKILPLPEAMQEEQYNFAKAIFRALKAEQPLALQYRNGSTAPLGGDDRSHLEQVLTDYFRLIGKI